MASAGAGSDTEAVASWAATNTGYPVIWDGWWGKAAERHSENFWRLRSWKCATALYCSPNKKHCWCAISRWVCGSLSRFYDALTLHVLPLGWVFCHPGRMFGLGAVWKISIHTHLMFFKAYHNSSVTYFVMRLDLGWISPNPCSVSREQH